MTIHYGNNVLGQQLPPGSMIMPGMIPGMIPGMMPGMMPAMYQQMSHQIPVMQQQPQNIQAPMNVVNMGSTMMTAGLPCSADKFDTAPQPPNPNNQAFMTRITNDPMLTNYTNTVLYSLATEIHNTAISRRSVYRIFMYNLYSNNNYANAHFVELGTLLMERLRMAIAAGQVQSIETAIQSLVPDMVTITAGANVRRYPDLSRYVDQTMQRDGMEAANKLDSIIRNISGQGAGAMPNMVRNQNTFSTDFGSTLPPTDGANTMGRGSVTQQTSSTATPATNRYAAQLERYESIQAEEALVRASNNPVAYTPVPPAPVLAEMHVRAGGQIPIPQGNEFERQVAAAMAAPSMIHQPESNMQQFASHAQPVPQDPLPVPKPPIYIPERHAWERNEMPATMDMLNRVSCTRSECNGITSYYFDMNGMRYGVRTAAEYGEVIWKPSALQPYHPAVCLNTQRVIYLILINGSVIAIVQPLPKESFHMDYDKHAVSAQFVDKAPIVPFTDEPAERPEYIDMPVDDVVLNTLPDISEETCIESAILKSGVDAAVARCVDLTADNAANSIEAMCVYQSLVKVAEPIMFATKEDARETNLLLSQLSTCKNFEDAANILKQIKNKNVFHRANKIVTERLNSVFAAELAIPDAKIDSFVDDYQDIMDLVAEHFPGAINDTLRSQQLKIMRQCLSSVVATNSVPHAIELIDSEDNVVIEEIMSRMIFINRNISVNQLGIYDHELSILFDENNKTVAVLQSQQPVLFAILQKIFEVKELKAGNYFANYLMTKEGVRYSISRGMLMGSAYLITKI